MSSFSDEYVYILMDPGEGFPNKTSKEPGTLVVHCYKKDSLGIIISSVPCIDLFKMKHMPRVKVLWA
jgi:hypothetical protein